MTLVEVDEEPGKTVELVEDATDRTRYGTVQEDGVVRNRVGEAFSAGAYSVVDIHDSDMRPCITCGTLGKVSEDFDPDENSYYCSHSCWEASQL